MIRRDISVLEKLRNYISESPFESVFDWMPFSCEPCTLAYVFLGLPCQGDVLVSFYRM